MAHAPPATKQIEAELQAARVRGCELARFAVRPSDIPDSAEFDRLYFGHEFCERLIPPADKVACAYRRARQLDVQFTVVTPFVTNAGLSALRGALAALSSTDGVEIVVNDWGVLRMVRREFPNLRLVVGRLLTKQKRGPRILTIAQRVPPSMVEHFRRSNIDAAPIRRFLRSQGVERVELDNLLQGIERKSDLPASLYFPFGYISTTRLCLTAACRRRTRIYRAILPCNRECAGLQFDLAHRDMPVPIVLRGNTQFFRNDALPANMEELGIDRIVYQPEPPF